jgi:lysophospholipase L1-like esterase
MPRHFAKVAAAIAALAVAALAAEAALRLFHPIGFLSPVKPRLYGDLSWGNLVHRHSEVSGLAYELAPLLECESLGMRIRTNSRGMRGPEPLHDGTPGLARIAVLGDSYAFGYGVEEDASFPRLLQRELQSGPLGADRTFDVLNLGVCGYSTRDEVPALRKHLDLRPDLVLLTYTLNDPEIEPIQPLHRYFCEPEWWQHSHLLRAVAKSRRANEISRSGKNYFMFLHAPDSTRWRSVCEAFSELRRLADSRGFRVAVVIFPMMTVQRPWERYRYREIHEQVRGEAEENGFPVLDLLGPYSAHDPAELVLSPDDVHPNRLGNRIAATEIARLLERRPELLGTGDR